MQNVAFIAFEGNFLNYTAKAIHIVNMPETQTS